MKVIGITGGIGSGKSEVLEYLRREYGVYVCEADRVAKTLQQKGTDCYRAIVESFGEEILDEEGELDRAGLAEKVFASPQLLERLNGIVHPAVKEIICQEIEAQRAAGEKMFVLEAALLLEDHYDEICDEVWFIYADRDVRRRRLKNSRGYSDDRIMAIFDSQMTRDAYLERCDRAIDNSRSFDETCVQLDSIMDKM
ncbi:dephospho-CoA kinase [Faecalimonas umbilicata]|nr:dephospho-CoA kinase [Faecalimonas umbilicata]